MATIPPIAVAGTTVVSQCSFYNSTGALANVTSLDLDIRVGTSGAITTINLTALVTLTGATGGTFTLTVGANTTTALAYNATAGTVQTALDALASVGSGQCTVTGSAGGPYTIAFVAQANAADITGNGASLTGSTPTLAVQQGPANPSTGVYTYGINTTGAASVTSPNPIYRQWSGTFADGTSVVSGLDPNDNGYFNVIAPVLEPIV
jgi:hypothetical protein